MSRLNARERRVGGDPPTQAASGAPAPTSASDAQRPKAAKSDGLPAVEDALDGVKLAPPRTLFRRVNRVYAWATRTISQDEFETICETVRKHLDGREMYPEDAASWAQRVISAMAHGLNASASVASCDKSDICILVAYGGRPRQGMFFSRSLRLRDPRGLKRIG
jgi:hypothetical protein